MRRIARHVVHLLGVAVLFLCLFLITVAIGIWALVDWALQPKKEVAR